MGLSDFFVPPDSLADGFYGSFQLIFLGAVYAVVLMKASKMIADGSELLTLVLPGGLVGALILPVFGAVPDGAIVLFSGLGPDAQEQLKVGVGTLAGSTIMLLTIPWAASAALGRVDLKPDGSAALYDRRKGAPKLTRGWSMTGTGVQPDPKAGIPLNAKIMVATALVYLLIQGPAFADQNDADAASREKYWALGGLLAATAAFLGYSIYQLYDARAAEQQEARALALRKNAMVQGLVSMWTMIQIEAGVGAEEVAAGGNGKVGAATQAALRKLFDRFDADGSGELDVSELRALLLELGIKDASKSEVKDIMRSIGGDDMRIQFNEFVDVVLAFMNEHYTADGKQGESAQERLMRIGAAARGASSINGGGAGVGTALLAAEEGAAGAHEAEEEEDDEEEEEEEEEVNLTPFQIKVKAAVLLLVGVGLVTVFSDPMVDILSVLGSRWGINAFYISFIVTPLVSNASELISSIIFAGKKTSESIGMTYSQLLGAAIMNNTFCLAIFLALVFFQDLSWEFSAEVLSILAVEVAVLGVVLTSGPVMPTWKGLAMFALYPLSLVLVYVLENVAGWN